MIFLDKEVKFANAITYDIKNICKIKGIIELEKKRKNKDLVSFWEEQLDIINERLIINLKK